MAVFNAKKTSLLIYHHNQKFANHFPRKQRGGHRRKGNVEKSERERKGRDREKKKG